MIASFAAAVLVSTASTTIAEASRYLRSFGVMSLGKPVLSPRGRPGTVTVRFERDHNYFSVSLGPKNELRSIGWSATSGAYRAPKREVWQLPDEPSAKRRLDTLGKKIHARFQVHWDGYSYDARRPENLAFRASAFQHLSLNGRPILRPKCGYSISVSPIDGELRHVWIADELPEPIAGKPKISLADAESIVRRSVDPKDQIYGFDSGVLGYYLMPAETKARLVWRVSRTAPPTSTEVMKNIGYFVVDYVDAFTGTYLLARRHSESGEYWPSERPHPW